MQRRNQDDAGRLREPSDLVMVSPGRHYTAVDRINLYEFAFARAPNDVDVELTTTVTTGSVSVFTSKTERFPGPLRAVKKGTCMESGALLSTVADSSLHRRREGLDGIRGPA